MSVVNRVSQLEGENCVGVHLTELLSELRGSKSVSTGNIVGE